MSACWRGGGYYFGACIHFSGAAAVHSSPPLPFLPSFRFICWPGNICSRFFGPIQFTSLARLKCCFVSQSLRSLPLLPLSLAPFLSSNSSVSSPAQDQYSSEACEFYPSVLWFRWKCGVLDLLFSSWICIYPTNIHPFLRVLIRVFFFFFIYKHKRV